MALQTESPILTLYKERDQHADNHYSGYMSKLAKRYDLYRGYYRGTYATGRNHVSVPFVFSVIQTAVSRKAQALFGSYPYIEVEATNKDQVPSARKLTALINAQLEACGTKSKAVDFLLTGEMYGTAVGRVGWKTLRRNEQFRAMNPQTGQEEVVSGVVTRFDGPDWHVVDLLDFRLQPGARRIDEARWGLERYVMDLDELEMWASIGVYDTGAVAQLRSVGGPPSLVTDAINTRMQLYRSMHDTEARKAEKFAKPVYLEDMIGYVPSELAGDGFPFRLITIANKSVVVRNKPFPHWDGELPWFSYTPMQDPHYFHGVGKIEVIEKIQYLVNRWASQKADAMDTLIDPMWLVNRQAGVDTQNLYTRAGRVIGVDGAVDDTVIRPLYPDLRGVQQVWGELQQSWGWIQQATGIVEDTVMGLPSADRQTKAEFLGRQENVLTRQALEVSLAEEDFLRKLVTKIVSLNKQLLSVPTEVRLIGASAMTDPVTGLPLPPESATLTLDDLNTDFGIRIRGGSQVMSKMGKQQNLLGLLQTIQANPVAMPAINWVNMLRYTFETFDVPNSREFFNEGVVPMINQQPGAGSAGTESGIPLSAVLGGSG